MTSEDEEFDDDEGPVSEPPPGFEDEDEGEERRARRRRLERMLRETVRRGIEKGFEAGLGTISRTDKAIRGVVAGDLPREFVNYIFSQVDETKNTLVRVVAREVRDFLEATDLSQELQRALTSLSFEVRTEIRFVPNESGGVRPSVRSKSAPRRRRREDEEEPEPDEEVGYETTSPESYPSSYPSYGRQRDDEDDWSDEPSHEG